jgi:protein translocase SecG subunit
MKNILLLVQMVVGLALVVAILIQNKGTGFGRVWGAGPQSFTRRGLEKLVFRATFVLVAVLVIVSILQLVV